MMQKIVFITGANSGLGLATAIEAAQNGHIVYAGYRLSKNNLDNLDAPNINPVQANVRDADSMRAAIGTVLDEQKRLDVAILNAGISIDGIVEGFAIDDFKTVLDVNCLGVFRSAHAILPTMRSAKAGRIIVISSLSALVGLPGTAAYTASKFAVEGMCECLRSEISRFNIDLCIAQPGAFKTALGAKSDNQGLPDISGYTPLREHLEKSRSEPANAGDPVLAGHEIAALIDTEQLPIRIPIGDQARKVAKILETLSDVERASFSEKASKTEWWGTGGEAPSA